MYISYNGEKYHCTCKPAAAMRYCGLPDDFPAPVEGKIVLHADDGFVMREDNAADYLRQTFENGILTLTNEPESTAAEHVATAEEILDVLLGVTE